MSDTLLDYIHREAFPKVVRTDVRDCGCVYTTFSHGGMIVLHCPRHPPTAEVSLPESNGPDQETR